MPLSMTAWLRRHSMVLGCCMLAGIQAVTFFPGYVSFDVLSQLGQARAGVIDDVSPPAAALLFRAGERIVEGTGAIFLLNTTLFWLGTALLLSARAVSAWPVLLVAATATPLLVLLPHLWTDVHMLAVLAVCCGLAAGLETARRPASRALLFAAALCCLLWATWVRHNAILAVLPLAWMLALHASPKSVARAGLLRAAGVWVLLAAVLLSARAAAVWVVDRPTSVWAVTPMWDLQAISVASGQQRLPSGFAGPGLDVDQLERAFSPATAVPLFEGTTSGVRNPTLERLSAEDAHELLAAWATAVREHPASWLAHRMRVAGMLLGPHLRADLVHMVDSPSFLPGYALHGWRQAWHAEVRVAIETGKRIGLASAWPALMLGIGLLLIAWWRGRRTDALTACLFVSAALYGGSLIVLAPSAELRYLAWPLWALLAAGLSSVAEEPREARARNQGAFGGRLGK